MMRRIKGLSRDQQFEYRCVTLYQSKINYCEHCRKQGYVTEEEALEQMEVYRNLNPDIKAVYFCEFSGTWHMTKMRKEQYENYLQRREA